MQNPLILSASMLLIFFAAPIAWAQDSQPERSVGLAALLQGPQVDILVPVRTSTSFAIVPGLGLVWGEGASTDIHLGVDLRYYFRQSDVEPYLGVKGGILILSPKGGDTMTDGLIGLAGGAECFLKSNFSIGAEAQLNLALSSKSSTRFGNPGKKNLNTATAVFATIYF